ncbi:MAG: hypothetical protein KBD01_14770 [Acidobacteria bacterium]|nr:hypothetical protein [Acidobacteriota bacterium]
MTHAWTFLRRTASAVPCGLIALTLPIAALAAKPAKEPPKAATWSAAASKADLARGDAAEIVVSVKLEPNWHTFSLTQPKGGPLPTTLELAEPGCVQQAGPIAQSEFHKRHEPLFDMDVEEFSGSATFRVPVKVRPDAKAGKCALKLVATYQACDNKICLPPKPVPMDVRLTIKP